MPALNGYGSALRLKLDDGDAHARRGLAHLRMRGQMAKFLRTGAGGDPPWWLRLDDLVDKALVLPPGAQRGREQRGDALRPRVRARAKGEHAKAESRSAARSGGAALTRADRSGPLADAHRDAQVLH